MKETAATLRMDSKIFNDEDLFRIHKTYYKDEQIIMSNDSIICVDNFKRNEYDYNNSFLHNLIQQEIFIFKIEEFTAINHVDGKLLVYISRRYHDENNNMIAIDNYYMEPIFYQKEIIFSFK